MTTKNAIFTTILYNGVPDFNGNNIGEWTLKARNAINNSLIGKMNSVGTFTLAASTVSTEVKFVDGIIGPNTVLVYFPLTANAAAVFGSIYRSTLDPLNSIIGLTHTSNANTDKSFAFVLIG